MATIKVGYVPEHFSTPLHFAASQGFFRDHNLNVELVPFPSGTGHMVKSIESGEIAMAIGLTEGWMAALGNDNKSFKLVGKYVSSPLRWAISTGTGEASSSIQSVEQLKGGAFGISRVGSGSYVMAYVLAKEKGWLGGGEEPFRFEALDNFKGLRDGVNGGAVDAFMWEYFTSKKYYDSGEIRQIGEIYTPWPSWHIVAAVDPNLPKGAVSTFLTAVNEGISYFKAHTDEAITFISTNLDYSAEDAAAWLETVEFPDDVRRVDVEAIVKTMDVLSVAGLIKAGNWPGHEQFPDGGRAQ